MAENSPELKKEPGREDQPGFQPRMMGEGGELTKPHRKVYPKAVSGRFRRARNVISAFLQVVLFFGPWIQWGGQQAILLDLSSRRFHFFEITFWPQDTAFMLVTLIFLAVLLFASTALGGRMWCGYACPQTLLTESFVFVERFFEGDRAQRMRLDKAPWDAPKIARKLGKYAVWTGMAVWLGITFAAYFQNAQQLLVSVVTGTAPASTMTFITVVTLATLFNFGWFREQLCHYACPYARFQGAMFDQDSLIVGYDKKRGEPRGKAKQSGVGDCVDCTLCVQVCPSDIDIRNGLQLECIACTACIDACDGVMDKLDRPRGLVGYRSLNAIEGLPTRIVRPRIIVYGALLAALAGLFTWLLIHRPLLVLDVMRKPGTDAVHMATAEGQVSNLYHIKLINKDRKAHELQLSIDGFNDATLISPVNPVPMDPDSQKDIDVFVTHSPQGLRMVTHFRFKVVDTRDAQLTQTQEASFLGPSR